MPIGSMAMRVRLSDRAAARLADVRDGAVPRFPLAVQPQPDHRHDSAPTAPAPSPEWTGEDGASGHPTMTRAAILAAAANFRNCLEGLWPLAARRSISRASFDQHTAGLTPDLRIMDLLDSQPEFTKTPWEYLDILVGEERILSAAARCWACIARRSMRSSRPTGSTATSSRPSGGSSSKYGTMIGERPVIRSTATLACIGRRQNYFRDEFLAALEILHRGDVHPDNLKGSWAGAFGPTQFMPTTFQRFALDFDRDGKRDVVLSIPDVVASTANNLKRDGWAAGQTWGYEVTVPPGFDYLLADRSRELTLAEWEKRGLRRPNGQPFPNPGQRAYLMVPAGARGPSFLMLNNFRTIMKYNPAEAYALAIGHLADRLRGGAPFVQTWPREERALSRTERFELQQLLAGRGFDVGEPDGMLGARSRAAIRDFQARAGLVPDGFASSEVLNRLRGQ